MSTVELFILSAALGTDLFSVSIPIGMKRVRLRIILKAGVVFAVFHIVLLLAGYWIGHQLGTVVEHVGAYHIDWPAAAVQNWASIFGALVIVGLGCHMIRRNFCERSGQSVSHPLQGLAFMALAFSVSVDALAAGFSMGMMDVDLIKLSIILGLVIFSIAVCGLTLGRKVGALAGCYAEAGGGLVLVLLGADFLLAALK